MDTAGKGRLQLQKIATKEKRLKETERWKKEKKKDAGLKRLFRSCATFHHAIHAGTVTEEGFHRKALPKTLHPKTTSLKDFEINKDLAWHHNPQKY